MSLYQAYWSKLLRLRPFVVDQTKLRGVAFNKIIKYTDNLTINQVIESNKNVDDTVWPKMRNEIFDSQPNVNEHNVDSIIINRFCDAKKHHIALDYVNYLLKATNKKVNIAVTGKYFRLLHNYKRSVDLEEVKNIFELYDNLKSKHDVFDSMTAEYCLLGLSLTDRWREGIELLDTIEQSSISRGIAFSAIIAAAYDHDDYDLAWTYMNRMAPRLFPNLRVYMAYINYCKRKADNQIDLEAAASRIFGYWANNDIFPQESILMLFVDILKSTGQWNIKATQITDTGICQACNHQLPDFNLDKEDFLYFKEFFMKNVFVGKDLYCKTTPNELRFFKKFVESIGSYDVVIDGLNVAYTISKSKRSKRNHSIELKNIVSAFVKENKKIFVLGRKHMATWPKEDMNYIKNNSFFFLTENLSNDDTFLLYAAISGGLNTYFTSRDLMRQHLFSLADNRVKRIFRHWQMTRQIFPTCTNFGFQRNVSLIYPPTFVPTAHKDANGWHIPYNVPSLETQDKSNDKYPKSWMCLRKKVV